MAADAETKKGDQPPGKKRAVVLVHGIGEQRPLETLRSFVDTVYRMDTLAADDPDREVDPRLGVLRRIWVVPDELTGSAELRRITSARREDTRRFDFFEFYWADIMDGNRIEMIWSWFRGLLLRPWSSVPQRPQVRIAWLMLWALVVVVAFAALVIVRPEEGFFPAIVAWVNGALVSAGLIGGGLAVGVGAAMLGDQISRGAWGQPGKAIAVIVAGVIAIGLGLTPYVFDIGTVLTPKVWAFALGAAASAIIAGVLVPYVGDIVRYVRATPSTVAKRKEVRERGLELLRHLHAATDAKGEPAYEKIIVVAHSLGTIVAYDVLQMLWQEIGPTHKWPAAAEPVPSALKAVDGFVGRAGEKPFPLTDYQAAQDRLCAALVETKQRWLVSDFVTVGSPLVHTPFLLADGDEQVERLFRERTLAACPPRPDSGSTMLYGVHGGKAQYAHFASAFAAVRWTNLYDEHWFPFAGDIVSGPLAPIFGPGVDDRRVEIRRSTVPVHRRLTTHTFYWAWQPHYDRGDVPDHIHILREIIHR